ncbi:MAG: 50S ribosomal protein L6 [Candidatus Neomarinimicrobiota bacterium]
MSRIGKKIITVPEGVTVKIQPSQIDVSGPKGSLNIKYHKDMTIKQQDNILEVLRPSDNRLHRSLHGTTRQIIANCILGVTEGFSKDLEIRGIGYQANMQGKYLVLQLGYSHDIYFEPPEGINIKSDRTTLSISGINKQLVGEVSAKIRSFRKPEPFKGKGIRYKDEYVRSKQGKTVGATNA